MIRMTQIARGEDGLVLVGSVERQEVLPDRKEFERQAKSIFKELQNHQKDMRMMTLENPPNFSFQFRVCVCVCVCVCVEESLSLFWHGTLDTCCCGGPAGAHVSYMGEQYACALVCVCVCMDIIMCVYGFILYDACVVRVCRDLYTRCICVCGIMHVCLLPAVNMTLLGNEDCRCENVLHVDLLGGVACPCLVVECARIGLQHCSLRLLISRAINIRVLPVCC